MKKIVPAILLSILLSVLSADAQSQFKALLFSETAGWHHPSINEGVIALQKLANKHQFQLDWQQQRIKITDDILSKYEVVVFLSTTEDIFDEEEQGAIERFIKSGKGYVGIHAAADTEYDWPWYRQLVGRMFRIHPVIQTARITKINNTFPGLDIMPLSRIWTDEWYEYGAEEVEGLKYLVTVDENTYNPVADWGRVAGDGMGDFHPISWYHEFDGGRSFYTGMGHKAECYSDDIFLEHVYGGIYWAATGRGIKE